MPALFQFRNTRDGAELSVDLCFGHLKEAQKAVQEMQTLRKLEAEQSARDAFLLWGKDGEETEATL
jgi:hypothetical protein